MIVSTIGYGATGSGAVYALLKEFSSIQDKSEVEFKLAYQVSARFNSSGIRTDGQGF